METTVDFHTATALEMIDWCQAVPAQEEDRRMLLFGVYCPDIAGQLRAAGGDPVTLLGMGARRIAGLEPPVYDWRYTADLWVRFVVRVTTSRLRSPRCRVTVLHLSLERLASPSP